MKWYLNPTVEELGPYGKELFLNYPSTIKFFYLQNEEPMEKVYVLDVDITSWKGQFRHRFNLANIYKKHDSFDIEWVDKVVAEWSLDKLLDKICYRLDNRQASLLREHHTYEGLHVEFKLHLTRESLKEDIRSWVPKF